MARPPLAALVAFLVTGCGGGGETKVVRGDAAAGFPLRGSLKGDSGAMQDAVSAWRARKGSGADEPGQGIDGEAAVTVLWAGHVPDREVVVASQNDRVATIERPSGGDWAVRRVQRAARRRGSGPLGTGEAVLVPAGAGWRYVDADFERSDQAIVDGLVVKTGTLGTTLGNGFVLPAAAPAVRAAIFVQAVGPRMVAPRTLAAIERTVAARGAIALWQAVAAPDKGTSAAARRVPATPPELRVVWTGRLPGVPTAAVVAESDGPSLSLGFADQGSADSAIAGSQVLGRGRGRTDPSTPSGALVAGRYVQTDPSGTKLLLAGVGVRTLTAVVGRRRISRRAPFALIDAPWGDDASTAPDTTISGRTAGGRVVAPLRDGP